MIIPFSISLIAFFVAFFTYINGWSDDLKKARKVEYELYEKTKIKRGAFGGFPSDAYTIKNDDPDEIKLIKGEFNALRARSKKRAVKSIKIIVAGFILSILCAYIMARK